MSRLISTLSLSAATISHHLAVLEHAGLVEHVKQGRHGLYRATGETWGVVSEAEVREIMASEMSQARAEHDVAL